MIRSVTLDHDDRTVLLMAAGVALVVGVLAAATSPLVLMAALIGGGVLTLILARPVSGLWLFVAVVASLPFGVIPVPLAGAQLTFVDAVLIATFAAVLFRALSGSLRIPLGAPGVALLAFVVVAMVAFAAAAVSSPITSELVRRTGKLLVGLLFFLIARALLTTPERLTGLTRWLMYAGAIQGAIGAALSRLTPETQLAWLSRLQVIGYPTSDVLRYVPGANDTYTSQLRATGTSVDPNVFGGTLMLAMALIIVQWASPRPVLPRKVLLLLALPTAAGVLLSLSRASWLGLAAGLLLAGALSYRRILLVGLVGGLAMLVAPPAQTFLVRFVSGLSTSDPATAFRVGEYANALTLLARYPLLGIGFGPSPDIDVTAGVSSVYLLVGEQTGLLGLGVYLVALGATWLTGVRAGPRADEARLQGVAEARFQGPGRAAEARLRGGVDERVAGRAGAVDPRIQGIRVALLAAFSGALVTGLLDHYFANQVFPHAVALFWLYAAGLVAASQVQQRRPAGETAT